MYDAKCIGRGFEVHFEDTTVCLRMFLPTSKHEITLFYDLIEAICKKVKVEYVIRDEGIVPLSTLHKYVAMDIDASQKALKEIGENVCNQENRSMTIFGALNPLDLGKKEVKSIGDSIDKLEKWMHKLQSKDVYYAGPSYYQRNDETIFGVYFVGENIETVVPKKPYAPFNRVENVDSYYVRIPDYNDIPYDEFIRAAKVVDEYDENHHIVCLDFETIDHLAMHYSVDMGTKLREKGVFFGKVIDEGSRHLHKIKTMELAVDELASLNHLAVFLRWMAKHHLLSDRLKRDVENVEQILQDESVDVRRFMLDEVSFGGQLKENHFNEEGKEFALQFYRFNDDEGYPNCVDMFALSVLGEEKYHCEEYKNEAYLFVPYSKKYGKGLSKYIDQAWKKFKNKG